MRAKSSPPSAGPTTVPDWNAIERHAIALGISSKGTSEGPSARAAGFAIAAETPLAAGEHEEGPELLCARNRDHEEERRDADAERERGREDEPAREPVGEMPGREREQEQRQELAEADQAEVERRVIDREDLPTDGHRDHLDAEGLRDQRDPEQQEVALLQHDG